MTLRTIRPRVQPARSSRTKTLQSKNQRTTGTALQRLRRRLWQQSPCCAVCGRAVRYPDGFELDHIVPLWMGGPDDESNMQLLCVHWSDDGGKVVKMGCHADKTAQEAIQRG